MSRLVAVPLIALIALTTAVHAQENLLPNPSFETGSRSVHIESYDPDCRAYWTTRNIPMEACRLPGRRWPDHP